MHMHVYDCLSAHTNTSAVSRPQHIFCFTDP